MPVGVGVLGYIAASTRKELKRVGFWSKPLAIALSEAALRCSYVVIFISHKTLSWSPLRMTSDLSNLSL